MIKNDIEQIYFYKTQCTLKKKRSKIQSQQITLLYSESNDKAAITCPSCSVISEAAPAVPPKKTPEKVTYHSIVLKSFHLKLILQQK